MYTAHGDGSICAWKPEVADEADEDEEEEMVEGVKAKGPRIGFNPGEEVDEEQDRKRKSKAAMLGDLVQGLTKKMPR